MQLKRFTHTDYNEELLIHPAVHIFFFITFIKGLLLGPLQFLDFVNESLLLQATAAWLDPSVMVVWGFAALVVTGLNTYGIAMRKKTFHNAAAMGGFMLWTYAIVMYLMGGFFYHFIILGLPNLAFWTFYYIATKQRTAGT